MNDQRDIIDYILNLEEYENDEYSKKKKFNHKKTKQ